MLNWGQGLGPERAWELGWSLAVKDCAADNNPLGWAHLSFTLRPDNTNAWGRDAFWRGYVEAVLTAFGH